MDRADLDRHLSQGEGITTEFKRCGNQPGDDTYESICSFANRQGGNVFLGVDDGGNVVGVPVERSSVQASSEEKDRGYGPEGFTAVEYAASKGVSLRTAQRLLKEAADKGELVVTRVGRTHLYVPVDSKSTW